KESDVANATRKTAGNCSTAHDKNVHVKSLDARRRLRPVLMTSLAAILGMLPLALALGSGAELLQPLAIAVIGGLAVALLFSLVVTPTVYAMLRGQGSSR
ncbi:MAG TPA: efflux RND transporter permease subunit, partial [Pyrinomonadaceae bacterium]